MHIETERKFLIKDSSYKQLAVKAYRIKQGYIAHDGGNTVRVRIRDNQGFLTIKGPSMNGISRFEWEREIPLQEAEELFLLCRGGAIDKTRYVVPVGHSTPETLRFASSLPPFPASSPCENLSPAGPSLLSPRAAKVSGAPCPTERYFEVDEFYGENEGLVMAEIELESPEELFERPEWLGEEVTGDKRYYNSYLLIRPYKNW